MEKTEIAPLETWIKECITHLKQAQGFDVHPSHKDEFLLLYGIAARVMRYSDAYLRLASSDLRGEAAVLARAALEHAVALQWIFTVDGAINRFQVDVAHGHLEHYRTLAEWLGNEEIATSLPSPDQLPRGKRLPKFMEMMRDLDDGKFLETSYHVLSQQVHVTHGAVTSFVEQGPEEVHITYEQDYGYQYQATYVVAVSCMLTRWVVAKLTYAPDLLERMERVSQKLIIPMTLIDNLDKEKRRSGL